MTSDGPPCRAGSQYAGAKHESDQGYGEDTAPVFPVVAGVDKSKQGRSDPGRLPETRPLRFAQFQKKARNQTQRGEEVDAVDSVSLAFQHQVQADAADNSQRPPEVQASCERELHIATKA